MISCNCFRFWRFFHREKLSASLQLVQADDYLGMQAPEDIGRFEALKAPVSTAQMTLADSLFRAFRQATPAGLATLLDQDLRPLSYMRNALLRLFEELPSTASGLSRTQSQALKLIERDALPAKRLFAAVQETEEAIFMGDWSFWRALEELAFNASPLISGLPHRFAATSTDAQRRRYLDAEIALTKTGRAVLAGEADHVEINRIDRWQGGTHLAGDAIWRWDGDAAALTPPARRDRQTR